MKLKTLFVPLSVYGGYTALLYTEFECHFTLENQLFSSIHPFLYSVYKCMHKLKSVSLIYNLVSAYISVVAECEVHMSFSMFSGSQVELKQCHYLVDLATETEAPLEPRYATNKDEWSIVADKPFLDTTRQVFSGGVYGYFSKRVEIC